MTRSRSRSVGLSTAGPSSPTQTATSRSRTPVMQPSVVITTPPWARDDSPSPTQELPNPLGSSSSDHDPSTSGLSPAKQAWDVASTDSSFAEEFPDRRWWVFTRPRLGWPGGSHSGSPGGGGENFNPNFNPHDDSEMTEKDGEAVPMSETNHASGSGASGKGKAPEDAGGPKRPMAERLKSSVLAAADHTADRWRHYSSQRRTSTLSTVTPGTSGLPRTDTSGNDAMSSSPTAERSAIREHDYAGVHENDHIPGLDDGYLLENEKGPSVEIEHDEDNRDGSRTAGTSSSTIPTTTAVTNESSGPVKKPTLALHLEELPPPTPFHDPFTMAQSATPGWQSPWVEKRFPGRRHAAGQGRSIRARAGTTGSMPNWHEEDGEDGGAGRGSGEGGDLYQTSSSRSPQDPDEAGLTNWARRRRRFRNFILNHNATPIILRLVNLALTTSTLGVAVRERRIEIDHHALGIVGSSITLCIIFAPLTIIHVFIAIYLDYFGRPLGLWQTSWKLLHTLSETLFICLWSAALSVAFDNYYTSPLMCVPASRNDWWNSLPPAPNPLGPTIEGSVGDTLCDHTLALVILVFLGMLMYCLSLFVSLFRIFEKVKYQQHNRASTLMHV